MDFDPRKVGPGHGNAEGVRRAGQVQAEQDFLREDRPEQLRDRRGRAQRDQREQMAQEELVNRHCSTAGPHSRLTDSRFIYLLIYICSSLDNVRKIKTHVFHYMNVFDKPYYRFFILYFPPYMSPAQPCVFLGAEGKGALSMILLRDLNLRRRVRSFMVRSAVSEYGSQ